jgi:hypothetical protein
MIKMNLILKSNIPNRFRHAKHISEQVNPEWLALALLIPLALPIGGEFLRGGSLCGVCHRNSSI